jgi:hypothetical protein
MSSLSFHDYVSRVLPQKLETQKVIFTYTQELCNALEKNHLLYFAEDHSKNKSSFIVQEHRKYLRILETNPASWYQECIHVFVNKENGNLHLPTIRNEVNKKVKLNLLDDQSRTECLSHISDLNAHLRLQKPLEGRPDWHKP